MMKRVKYSGLFLLLMALHLSSLAQSGFTSDLPIIRINTNNQEIPDEPGIIARFEIIHNPDNLPNNSLAQANEYVGDIDIEIRGESSQDLFDKKSYGFETKDEFGEDLDASFLNFPEEEDWVLYGPYSDKTLLRNQIVMHLGRQTGQYASRTKFVELVINGKYEGIYLLMERIKRDKHRVDIAKLRQKDVQGDELTGGYIIRIDKGQNHWNSNFDRNGVPGWKLEFQHYYPRIEEIQAAQVSYIRSYVDSFERALKSSSFTYGGKRYDEYIDTKSFIDNFIINELSKNVDAYRLSSYFHKKKDSDGGKMYAGPLWDFNLSLRNADFCFVAQTDGWVYSDPICSPNQPFWWTRLWQDPIFREDLRCQWWEYRNTWLTESNLFEYIDSQVDSLDLAIVRNFTRWNILGTHIWPNPWPIPETYDEEIQVLKDWISERIIWMSHNIGAPSSDCNFTVSNDEILTGETKIFPNPTEDYLTIRAQFDFDEIQILDVYGRLVTSEKLGYSIKSKEVDVSPLASGAYILILKQGKLSSQTKFIKL